VDEKPVNLLSTLTELLLAKTPKQETALAPGFSSSAESFLESLVMQIIASREISSIKVLQISKFISPDIFKVFNSVIEINSFVGSEAIEKELKEQNKSKLVFGNFPINQSPKEEYESSLFNAVKYSSLIDKGGIGVFILPSYWHSFNKLDARKKFREFGREVTGIIRVPTNFFQTALRPIIVLVEPVASASTFLLDANSYETVDVSFENFLIRKDSGHIATGIWSPHDDFEGFEMWAAKQKLLSLSGAYRDHYQELPLADVSFEMNLARHKQEFSDKQNAVYIPLIGNGDSTHRLEDVTMKHQNYCQIIVDSQKVIPLFLCSFLNSPYGKTRLELMKQEKGGFIPKLNKEQLKVMKISLPEMQLQKKICDFVEKLSMLRKTILNVEENFALNPIETKTLLPTIETALSAFNQLSAGDKIKSLIRAGESKTLEFKQTFTLDVKTGSRESFISDASLKTVAAFLNTDGGDLLVGVNDKGEIVGVEEEIKKLFGDSNDKYLLHFKNIFKSQIGEQYYPLVNYQLETVDEHVILHVVCGRSDQEVFVSGKDFYIRTNPATDRLDGPKQIQYIRKRFG
jgi:hypothetical protein